MQSQVSNRASKSAVAAIWIIPAVLLLAVWIYLPIIQNLYYSFFDWKLNQNAGFVGLDNYARLTSDNLFWSAIWQTVLYALVILPAALPIPLILAVMLWQRTSRLGGFYRALIFLPVLLAPVAVAASWQFILNPLSGVANHILGWFGAGPVNWLGEPKYALVVIAVITYSKVVAQNFLLFFAALSALPKSQLEAATLDGASATTTMQIVLPQIKGSIAILGVLSTIAAGQWAFNNIVVLTGGGPEGSTDNIYYYIYRTAFDYFQTGTAAAASVILIILTIIVALLANGVGRLTRRRS